MESLCVWTDGSSIRNGTPSASCGIGIFYAQDSTKNISSRLPDGRQTNNRAELCAILYALCTNSGEQNITIYTDSKYSISCITDYSVKWEMNGWKTSQGRPVEWEKIIRYICLLIDSRTEKGSTTNFEYVKAHSDNYGNNYADQLAHQAATDGNVNSIIRFLEKRCSVPFS